MWMAILVCLLVAFLYLAIKRMSGSDREIPDHILQANAALVVPPVDHQPAQALPPKPPQLSNVPPIHSGSFPTNSIPAPKPIVKSASVTKPDFAFTKQPNTSNRIQKTEPKPVAAASFNRARSPLPKPAFVPLKKTATADATAESIGQRRAKQLAALTNGLPERLNQIQSSVKQATAELSAEEVPTNNSPPAVADNGFVPISPPKPVVKAPLKSAAVTPSKQFVIEKPAKPTKPIPIQPAIENTFVSNPLVASSARVPIPSPALAPIPSPSVARIPPPPVKQSPAPNTFEPLRSIRPVDAPEVLPVAVEAPKLSLPVEPVTHPVEIVKPVEPLRHSRPELKQHLVQHGESFFTIAQQHYGDAQWFRALRLANQSVAGGELPVGVSLTIPTTAELARQFPEYAVRTAAESPTEAQQRIYVTQAGDTLFDIARRKTGQGSRFSEIIGANELRLPAQIRASDELPEGLRLVLPESSLQ